MHGISNTCTGTRIGHEAKGTRHPARAQSTSESTIGSGESRSYKIESGKELGIFFVQSAASGHIFKKDEIQTYEKKKHKKTVCSHLVVVHYRFLAYILRPSELTNPKRRNTNAFKMKS
jgi:hypothetical protein